MKTVRQQEIFGVIMQNQPISISEISKQLKDKISIPTLNRELTLLKNESLILSEGSGPNVKYRINVEGLITTRIDQELFFHSEPDERKIINRFNIHIIDKLSDLSIFTDEENTLLEELTNKYRKNTTESGSTILNKEFERLMIELSWKSSQIEGNTYDLLDTEQLLKYNIPSPKHSEYETNMLLNHKVAIEYTRSNSDLYQQLSLNKVMDIHTLLTRELGIEKSIRKRIVRITGSNYSPPEMEYVVEEALNKMCVVINSKKNVFEKALIAILLISYIQPFNDGNKRTARLTANAILMAENCCPLSFRSISPSEYKKSILLFYELNNVEAFKKIFITQYKFAVENYF
jgi:Fic family protein